MPSYSFTLILDGVSEVTRDVEDSLYEAGCDDALLGTRDGVTYLDFDREAASLADAICSAISNTQAAGFQVARVEPDDLVTAAEIARRAGRSRESIRQLATGRRGRGGVPAPISSVTTSSPLWRWTKVAQWFGEAQLIDAASVRDAETIGRINSVLDLHRRMHSFSEAKKLWQALESPKIKKRASAR